MDKQPEVIVFQDGRRRPRLKATRAEKVSVPFERSKVYEEQKLKIERDGLDFQQTMREISSLAAKSIVGKDRKKGEKELLISLGAKEPNPSKMPYPRYQNMIRKRRKCDKDTSEVDKMVSKRRKNNVEREARGRGWWQDTINNLNPLPQKSVSQTMSSRTTKTRKFKGI